MYFQRKGLIARSSRLHPLPPTQQFGEGTINDSLQFLAIDPFLMPFRKGSTASDQAGGQSAWSRPVGDGLTTEAQPKPITTVTVNHTNNFTHWAYLARRSDPLKTISDNGYGGGRNLGFQMHIANDTHGHPDPTENQPGGATRDSGVVILAEHTDNPGQYHWHDFYGFENINDGDWTNVYQAQTHDTDWPSISSNPAGPGNILQSPAGAYDAQGHLTDGEVGGDGLPKYWPAAGNVPYIYSILRQQEIETAGFPIRHAIFFSISRNSINSLGSADPYVWPAQGTDGGTTPAADGVPMGSLFVIPEAVDVTSLGLSEIGVRLARAMQRYGLYLMDGTGDHPTNPSTETRANFYLDENCSGATRTTLDSDLAILFPSNPANAVLEIATNNAEAQSVSGGGTGLIGHLPNTWNTPGTGHTVTDGATLWNIGATI